MKKQKSDWIRLQMRDRMESGTSAILNSAKDGQPSTKVGLMSPGACHIVPSFIQGFNFDVLHRIRGFPWRPNSDEVASAIAFAFFCSLFSSDSSDCTLPSTVSQLHTLPRMQGSAASPDSFLRGYDPSLTLVRPGRGLTLVDFP